MRSFAGGVWSPPRTIVTRDDVFINWADFPSIVAGPESELDTRVCDCCPRAMVLTRRGPVVAYRDRSKDETLTSRGVVYVAGTDPPPAKRIRLAAVSIR